MDIKSRRSVFGFGVFLCLLEGDYSITGPDQSSSGFFRTQLLGLKCNSWNPKTGPGSNSTCQKYFELLRILIG
jgi:hypothetical protein